MSHDSFLLLHCHENLQRLYKTHCHVPWFFSIIALSWKLTKAVQNTSSCPVILFYSCTVLKIYKRCTKHFLMSRDSFLLLCCHENFIKAALRSSEWIKQMLCNNQKNYSTCIARDNYKQKYLSDSYCWVQSSTKVLN